MEKLKIKNKAHLKKLLKNPKPGSEVVEKNLENPSVFWHWWIEENDGNEEVFCYGTNNWGEMKYKTINSANIEKYLSELWALRKVLFTYEV